MEIVTARMLTLPTERLPCGHFPIWRFITPVALAAQSGKCWQALGDRQELLRDNCRLGSLHLRPTSELRKPGRTSLGDVLLQFIPPQRPTRERGAEAVDRHGQNRSDGEQGGPGVPHRD